MESRYKEGATGIFKLDEQISRARHAAARMDAGFYFTDEEMDAEESGSEAKMPPQRSIRDSGNWL